MPFSHPEIMKIFHDGELAAMDGLPLLASPYIDQPEALYIWMHARTGCPLETLVSAFSQSWPQPGEGMDKAQACC